MNGSTRRSSCGTFKATIRGRGSCGRVFRLKLILQIRGISATFSSVSLATSFTSSRVLSDCPFCPMPLAGPSTFLISYCPSFAFLGNSASYPTAHSAIFPSPLNAKTVIFSLNSSVIQSTCVFTSRAVHYFS